jgi:hypothetical protein
MRSSPSCAKPATIATASPQRTDVVLWRAGLQINEALCLTETDPDQRRGSYSGQARQKPPPARSRHGRLGLHGDRAMAR